MTLHDAYDKAIKMGKRVSLTASKQTKDDGSSLEYYSLMVDDMHVVCCVSFEDAFEQISKLNPAKAKSDKIAKLKAELEELES